MDELYSRQQCTWYTAKATADMIIIFTYMLWHMKEEGDRREAGEGYYACMWQRPPQ